MGTLKIQMGGYLRQRILSNTGIFDPVVGETLKVNLDGKPVNLKTGDLESKIEVSSTDQGRTAVFIYPLDNDPQEANGRLYVEDRFDFDPEGKRLVNPPKRSFRMGKGAVGSPFWEDLHTRLKELEKKAPLDQDDPKIKKFFSEVVLNLPDPVDAPDEPPAPETPPKSPLLETKPEPTRLEPEFKRLAPPRTQISGSEKLSVLSRVKANILPEAAQAVDQLVSRFAEGLSDPIVLGSLLAGSMAFRAGEAALFGPLSGRLHPILGKALTSVSGLIAEASVFELTSRKLQSIGMGEASSPLWRLNGFHGLGHGLARSFITFGAFRGGHALLNPAVSRMSEGGFQPFGRFTVPVLSHGGSLGILHGVNEAERWLNLREKQGPWATRLVGDAAFYTQMLLAGGMVEMISGPKGPHPFDFVMRRAKAPEKPVPVPQISIMHGELPPEAMGNLDSSIPLIRGEATERQGPFAMISTQGIGRGTNEDLVLRVSLPTGEHYYLAVDGMGGHESGEIAASLAGLAFQTELVRSNDMGRALKIANEAIYIFNLKKHFNREPLEDAIGAAHDHIANPPPDSSFPVEDMIRPPGAVLASLKVTPSAEAEGPSKAEFQWVGDARATVFRRGPDGRWHWIYRTVDESLPYHPGIMQVGTHFQPGGAGRTLAAMRHELSPVVTGSIGGKPTVSPKTTPNGEVPEPTHVNGARPADELSNGLLLEQGDLILLGSDGFWENFGHTRYIENLLEGVRTPEAAVEVLTLKAHRQMAMFNDATQFFETNPNAVRYDLTIDGLPAWIDPEGTIFNEHDQPVDHCKLDNFSLIAYLHEPGKLEPVSAKPPVTAEPPEDPTLPREDPVRADPTDITMRLLKPGHYFAASEENGPERPRRSEEAVELPGAGEVAAFTHEGFIPFPHSKFDNSTANPQSFGFALDYRGNTFLITAAGVGAGAEEAGALAARGLMEGFSRDTFSSLLNALELVHPLVHQKTGARWEGGLVSVGWDGKVEGHLQGGEQLWILRAGEQGLLETVTGEGALEASLNPSDTLFLLNRQMGILLDERAIERALEGRNTVDEMRTGLHERGLDRQKMRRDFGPALGLNAEADGPLSALVYRHKPSPDDPRPPEGSPKKRGLLPASLVPPVPLTRPLRDPLEAPESIIPRVGMHFLGIDPNLPQKPRRAEHTILIPYFGEISAMTHEGIDKHVLVADRAYPMNEDAYGIFIDSKERPVIIVADGLGGYEAGEVASARAIEGAFSVLASGEKSLGEAFMNGHREIQFYNSTRIAEWNSGGQIGPQPTLAKSVAAAARVNLDGSVEVALTGDARIWVLRPRVSGAYQVIDPYPPDSLTGNLLASGILKSILEMNAHPNSNEVAGCLGHKNEPRLVEEFGYQEFWARNPDEYQILNSYLSLPSSNGVRVPYRLRKGDSLLLMSDGVAELFDPELLAETIRDQTTAEGIRTAIEKKTYELLSLYQSQAFGMMKGQLKELPDGRFIDSQGGIYNSSSPIKRVVANVGPDNVVMAVYTHQRETPEGEPIAVFTPLEARAKELRTRPTPAANMAVRSLPPQFLSVFREFKDKILPQLKESPSGDDGMHRGSYQLFRKGENYDLVAEKDIVIPMDGESLGTLNFTVFLGDLAPGQSRLEFTAEPIQQGSIPPEVIAMFVDISNRQRRPQ